MSVEELENITVLLLSLNPRRYKMRELNLDDSRLTDEKLRTLAPLVVRFRTVKIGGKQDYGVKGLEELRLYMEQIKGRTFFSLFLDILHFHPIPPLLSVHSDPPYWISKV